MTTTTTTTAVFHLYGIVAATAVLPPVDPAIGAPHLIPYGSVAALVGGPLAAHPQTTRATLLAHATLLNRVAAVTAVLPARFGTVLGDADEARAMLAEHEDDLRAALDSLRGRVQYTVKVQHVREALLQEIAETQPEVAALRDQLASGGAVGYYEQIRLGELVAQSLAAVCEADALLLWESLTAYADAAVPRTVTSVDAPFGGAFLVEAEHRDAFEAAAEELALRWQGRARMRLLGPLAPYDFVAAEPGPAPGSD